MFADRTEEGLEAGGLPLAALGLGALAAILLDHPSKPEDQADVQRTRKTGAKTSRSSIRLRVAQGELAARGEPAGLLPGEAIP